MSNVAQQQVPEGYKKTEVGIIPEDWDSYPISEICQLMTGGTPSTSNPDYYGDEYMFVSPADLKGQKYIYKTGKNLSSSGFKICRKFPQGSVLFTCIGSTIGKCGVATEELTSNQQINAVVPINDIFEDYIYYQLIFEAPRIKQQASEQAVPIINKSKFGESPIGLPRQKEEQTAIANALSDVDALIASLEKLIAKKSDIKTAAMQQLLTGKKRLPPFDQQHTGYQQTELGEIPADWEVLPLESRVGFNNGCAHENHIKEYGNYTVVNSKFVSTESAVVKYSDQCLGPVYKGNILMVMSDVPNGKAIAKCFVVDENDKYTLNQRICAIDPKEMDSKYLFFVLSRNAFYLQFDDGVKQTNLRRQDVLDCPIPVPSVEEQAAISTVISDMAKEIVSLKQRLNKTQQIKQGMMQELLTGKTRLPFDKADQQGDQK